MSNDQNPATPQLEDTWRAYLSYCNDRKLDRLSEFVHDTIRFNDQDVALADYAAAIDSNLRVVPDFHWEVADILTSDDTVAVRLTDTGTPVGEWLGIAPTGKSFRIGEYAWYRFRDGKIAEMWFVLDAPLAATQLAA